MVGAAPSALELSGQIIRIIRRRMRNAKCARGERPANTALAIFATARLPDLFKTWFTTAPRDLASRLSHQSRNKSQEIGFIEL
jgi:hypothetical protein